MKKLHAILAALLLLALPLSAVAMEDMDHGEMMQEDDMIMLGGQTQDDVKGMAHIKDVSEKMAEMDMDATHHFMMMFKDASSGDPIEEGMVAVKVTTPSGETRKPAKLMGMEGHFGADVTLSEKGTYKFEVGTKLKDGQKRTYEFDHTIE